MSLTVRPKDTDKTLEARRRAREDFVALGPNRSAKKLFDQYVALGEEAPSRNRNTLTEWRRLDQWDDAALRADSEITHSPTMMDIRSSGLSMMSGLVDSAVERLQFLMRCGDYKIELAATTEILDRVGLGKIDNKTDNTNNIAIFTSPPPADSPMEEKLKYFSEQIRQGRQ